MTVVQWSAAARVSGSDADQWHRDTSSCTCVSPCTCASVHNRSDRPSPQSNRPVGWERKKKRRIRRHTGPLHAARVRRRGERGGRRNKDADCCANEVTRITKRRKQRHRAASGAAQQRRNPQRCDASGVAASAAASLSPITLSCRCCHWMYSSSRSILTPLHPSSPPSAMSTVNRPSRDALLARPLQHNPHWADVTPLKQDDGEAEGALAVVPIKSADNRNTRRQTAVRQPSGGATALFL